MQPIIKYTDVLTDISPENFSGFFVGWQNPPLPETHLEILEKSRYRYLAIDTTTNTVVGFITAISDSVLAAYIPFLEVLPEYQGQGIGEELVRRMLETLKEYYMIDLLCDLPLQSFYEKMGMKKATGMMIRNFNNQSGKKTKVFTK